MKNLKNAKTTQQQVTFASFQNYALRNTQQKQLKGGGDFLIGEIDDVIP